MGEKCISNCRWKRKKGISQIFYLLNRFLAPTVPAGMPKNGVHMIYNDDCDVLTEKYFSDDLLVLVYGELKDQN